jgi:hypothetical protein
MSVPGENLIPLAVLIKPGNECSGFTKLRHNFINTHSSFNTFPQFAGIIYRNLLVQFTVIA